MDAKTINYIERHSELDIAVGHLIRLWREVEQGEEYGQTGVVLEHKAGHFDGTLHLLKDWTVREKL